MKTKDRKNPCPLGRRDFEKLALAGAAGALMCPRSSRSAPPLPDKSAAVRVGLAGTPGGADEGRLAGAVRLAAESVTDFSWLSKGDSVLIKPACNSGKPYPATTSPLALSAMIRLLKEKGAGRVVVSDMAGIEWVKLTPSGLKRGSTRKLMEKNGLLAAALSAGAEMHFPEEAGWGAFFEDEMTHGSNWRAGIMMPKIVKEVDHIVLMPRTGRHLLAGSTLGLKAAVGYWRTDTRLEYHRDAATLQEKTAEANTVRSLLDKQRLALTAADRVLTTFGPDQGYVSAPRTGLVIASQSIAAHDLVSLAWLLLNREETPAMEKSSFTRDPYLNQSVVHNINRVVVMMLDGAREARRTEKLVRNDINTVWDDRALNRAFQVLGGVPRPEFANAEESVPSALIKKLEELTRPAA